MAEYTRFYFPENWFYRMWRVVTLWWQHHVLRSAFMLRYKGRLAYVDVCMPVKEAYNSRRGFIESPYTRQRWDDRPAYYRSALSRVQHGVCGSLSSRQWGRFYDDNASRWLNIRRMSIRESANWTSIRHGVRCWVAQFGRLPTLRVLYKTYLTRAE